MSVLRTPRLSLEPWEDSFFGDLFRLASDERMMRFIGDGRPWSREYTTERHQKCLRHWEAYAFGWRAIFKDGVFSGVAALNRLGDSVPGIDEASTEIGWWVDPASWGHGVATEAALALREEAFRNLGTELLVARYYAANVPSGRVMAKLGMRMLGDRPGADGRTVRVYVLNRTAWQHAAGSATRGLAGGTPGISEAHRADRQRREDAP